MALPADHLLLGALADRARVDDDEIGRLERRRLLAAGREQPTGHLLRVAAVHLAAQGPDVEARQRGASGRYSVRRASTGASGTRGSAGATGATASRTGSERVAERESCTVRAMVRRRSKRPRRHAHRRRPTKSRSRSPTSGGTHSGACDVGVRAEVAVIVAAARRDQAVRGRDLLHRLRRCPRRTSGSRPRGRRGPPRPARARLRARSAPSRKWARTGSPPAARMAAIASSGPRPVAPHVAGPPCPMIRLKASSTLVANPASMSARAMVGRPSASSSPVSSAATCASIGSPISRRQLDRPLERGPGAPRAARRAPTRTPRRRGPSRTRGCAAPTPTARGRASPAR